MRNTEGVRQEKLETWVARRLKTNDRLRQDDYDFSSWAKDATKNLLQAGAVYEYARESRKLCGLLVLMNPKRPRNDWEIMRPSLIDGRKPEPDEIDTYPAKVNWLPCSFQNLNEHTAERVLGGFLYCLCDLADYLADNISFGELFRTKQDELEKVFGGLNELARVNKEFRYFLPIIDAVEVATQSDAKQATVWETVSEGEKRIISGKACSEAIAIQVHWRFTDTEIMAALKRFVPALRPRKPRQRKKGSRRNSVQAALDCLSAMRLASHLPKVAPPASPGQLAAWQSGESPDLKPSAIELFTEVRLGGRGNHIAESNFDNLITEAREIFKKSFPFGEDAANAPALADRVMMKSERVSSQDNT